MKRITQAETELEKAVQRIINRNADGDVESYLNDLMHGGCRSGMVSELIYYHDTVKFFKAHKAEISSLLRQFLCDMGPEYGPEILFGDKWDREDPLALDMYNQNLLAWFGFEETARILADRNGIEL